MLLRVCDTLGAEWLLNADHIVAIRRGNSEEVLLTTGEPLVLTSEMPPEIEIDGVQQGWEALQSAMPTIKLETEPKIYEIFSRHFQGWPPFEGLQHQDQKVFLEMAACNAFVSVVGCCRSVGFTSSPLPMGEQNWEDAPTFCFPVFDGEELEAALERAKPPMLASLRGLRAGQSNNLCEGCAKFQCPFWYTPVLIGTPYFLDGILLNPLFTLYCLVHPYSGPTL